MSRRTLMIAALSAAFAFAGGYALLDTMQPATTRAQSSSRAAEPSKVVAVPGSALVPVNDGSTAWMLVGPDGTVLAGPDGKPPAAGASPVTPVADLVGTYLEGFPEAYGVPQEAATKPSEDERRDRSDHDDDDHDSKDHKDEKHKKDHDDKKDHKDGKHHDDHDDHPASYALTTGDLKAAKTNARSRK